MKLFSFLPLLLLLLLTIFFISVTDASVLEQACKNAAQLNTDVHYEFCITSLQASPDTGAADLRGLAQIATNLSLLNATEAKVKIENSLNKPIAGSNQQLLNMCLGFYQEAIIPGLKSSVSAIGAGNLVSAKDVLRDVKDKPDDCETLFYEAGKTSPVAKENNDTLELASIALEILYSIL